MAETVAVASVIIVRTEKAVTGNCITRFLQQLGLWPMVTRITEIVDARGYLKYLGLKPQLSEGGTHYTITLPRGFSTIPHPRLSACIVLYALDNNVCFRETRLRSGEKMGAQYDPEMPNEVHAGDKALETEDYLPWQKYLAS